MPIVRISEDTKKRLEQTKKIMVHNSLDETIRWHMGFSNKDLSKVHTELKMPQLKEWDRGLKMELMLRPNWRALTYEDFPKGELPSGEGVWDVIYRNIETDRIKAIHMDKPEEEQNRRFMIRMHHDIETIMEHGRMNYVCDIRPVYAIRLTVEYREFICLYSLYPKRAKILRGVSLHPTTDYGK